MQLLTFWFLEVLTDAPLCLKHVVPRVLKPVSPGAADLSSEIFQLHGSAHEHSHLEAENNYTCAGFFAVPNNM